MLAISNGDDNPTTENTKVVTPTQNESPPQGSDGLSVNSFQTTASTDRTPPAQVTGLVVSTVSSTQLNLVWNRVTATDFHHYNIYRGISWIHCDTWSNFTRRNFYHNFLC